MQDDGEAPKAGADFELLKARIESLIAGIIEDTGELAEIVKKIRGSPSSYPGITRNTPGIEKKLNDLKNVLRSMDGFGRMSSTLPLTLFPTQPSKCDGYASIDAFVQMPGNEPVEFKGPYATLNDLFNQGLNLGTIVDFYSSSIAGMDACSTCAFIAIDAYMRNDTIVEKNVRFVTAEPMRYGTLFKRLEPVIGQDARLDCIKVAAIDTVRDARALLENLAFTLDVPKHGLVVINCIDTIIALLGYDTMARRDRLKSALFQALRRVARDNDAIVIITSLIHGKPRQHERETCDYMVDVEPQSADCIKFRVLGRGQAYINKRNDGYVVSTEPVSFAPPITDATSTERGGADKADDTMMSRVEAFNRLVLAVQDEAKGDPVAAEVIVGLALSRSIAASLEEALSLMSALKKMRLVTDLGDGKVTAVR